MQRDDKTLSDNRMQTAVSEGSLRRATLGDLMSVASWIASARECELCNFRCGLGPRSPATHVQDAWMNVGPVTIGSREFAQTSRRDWCWVTPLAIFIALSCFIVYATWAAFQNA